MGAVNIALIDLLERQEKLEENEWITLLRTWGEDDRAYAAQRAAAITTAVFGDSIFMRGLIEFTSYCKNDCLYCGIRRSNANTSRYRLTKDEILACCVGGYALGFRTFVLQGGDDPWYTDEKMLEIITAIRKSYPACALTLSIGERTRETYQAFFDAGANRFLLRHETADPAHYAQLHPRHMLAQDRHQCLRDLMEIGFQTGCGFMVGAPGQTPEHLARDFQFIRELNPHMVGIGPFIPHHNTPFKDQTAGSFELTLFLLSLVRIMCKNVLLPATTALSTINERGRELGILAGANVLMPNLSPQKVRDAYLLYDNKARTGIEAAEGMEQLEAQLLRIGRRPVVTRGDWQPLRISSQ